jgi:arylsulfatase A-like enzyme
MNQMKAPAARYRFRSSLVVPLACWLLACSSLAFAAEKPNILVIWGDDIGLWNLSLNNRGMMGYETPNIDRLAREGMYFTDYYGDQSCTAGRSSFITGQTPLRTGLARVGIPGAPLGLQAKDPTLAELLKPMGYTSGQFGKNHLGDRDEFLPTNHGFDEFLGNLYHLNAEEEPENPDYPKMPGFKERFGPRGVVHSFADGKIEDTGPLTKKRMETIDDETLAGAIDFIERANTAGKPFFVWYNATRMHVWTHLKPESVGKSGQGFYNDGMVEHDEMVGKLLDKLDQLGIANNTIVFYSTDNGPHFNTWPDAAITPFRGEKNSNWEGAYRVPAVVRWPGKIKAGVFSNEIMSHLDWLPTLMAAAGDDNINGELLQGQVVGDNTFKVHLDGYNFLPYLTGQQARGPRQEFHYFSDEGQPIGIRVGDWKIVYAEQRAKQFDLWREPFVELRVPKIFHLRRDPFERADENANEYNTWWAENLPWVYMGVARTTAYLQTFVEYPATQSAATMRMSEIAKQLSQKR